MRAAAVFEPVAVRRAPNGETRNAAGAGRSPRASVDANAHGTDIAQASHDGLAARRSNPNEETTCNPDS